jgi:cytochrome c553
MGRSGRTPWRAVAVTAWAAVFAGTVGCPALQAADAAAGRQKAAMCQTCHGIDGVGKLPDVPHIAGENTEYLVSQLDAFRSGKRQHEQMSIIASGLSDEDIADLAAWYSSIQFTVTVPE